MRRSHLILMVVFNVFWAGILSINLELGRHLTYTSTVTLRFGLAAAIALCLWPWLPGPTPKGPALLRTAIMGVVVFCIGHRLQVLGNTLGSAGNASILMGFEPVLTSVAAALCLREHVPWNRWAGFALCLGGIALLNRVWDPAFQWTHLQASVIFISSFLCEAMYSILGKPLGRDAGPCRVVALSLVAGTLANLAIDGHRTLSEAATLPWTGWVMFAYTAGPCTVAGYILWLEVIRDTPVNLVALTIFIQPVAGVLIAMAFLGERLHWGHLWGTLAIGAGLLVGFLRREGGPARATR
jgi:drug/metabolite transporter (DMT)-like permease